MDTMLRKALRRNIGLRHQLERNLLGDEGDVWEKALKQFLRKEPCWSDSNVAQVTPMTPKTESSILTLISEGEEIIIAPTDGSQTIAEAPDTFCAGLDPNFKNWGLNVRSQATPKTRTEVYELRWDVMFGEVLGSLDRPTRDLVLTQHQIVEFIEKHPKWLRSDRCATFFLFEKGGEFFVAHVFVRAVGLSADVSRFGPSSGWYGGCRHRVVVPEQTLTPRPEPSTP